MRRGANLIEGRRRWGSTLVAIALSSSAAACAQDAQSEGGAATATIYNRDGVPLVARPIAFQGGDGRVLAVASTDGMGNATGPMEVDGMVTDLAPFANGQHLVTHGGVQPGDHVVNAPQFTAVEAVSTSALVVKTTVPSVVSDTELPL